MSDISQESGAERRQFERFAARIEVRFGHASDAARAFRAYSLNLSVGGLCLRTQKRYELGELLRLELDVQSESFLLKGVVAWVRDGAIGVRFEDVGEEDRERLTRIVTAFGK